MTVHRGPLITAGVPHLPLSITFCPSIPTPYPALPAAMGREGHELGPRGPPDSLRTSAGVPPRRGAASAGTSGRARPLPAGTSGGRGGRPSVGAGGAALGAAPPPVGAGRAGAARRGEAARWGGRPAAWPRSGCCCSWRWGTPGLTGRSRRTATGECPPAAGSPALLSYHCSDFPPGALSYREVCSENKIATTRYPCLKPTGELTTCFR